MTEKVPAWKTWTCPEGRRAELRARLDVPFAEVARAVESMPAESRDVIGRYLESLIRFHHEEELAFVDDSLNILAMRLRGDVR